MRGDRSTGFVLSDFNTANLVGYLQNDDDLPVVDVSAAPYGQVQTLLVDPAHPIWPTGLDFVIVWTRPESVLGAFRDLLDRREASPDGLAREVDEFAALLSAIARPERPVFVPTWTLPPFLRGLGVVDLKDPSGLRGQLLAANARLVERLRPEPSVFTFDADRWMASAGRAPFHNRLWYAGKIPYANEVFIEAGADFKAALRRSLDARASFWCSTWTGRSGAVWSVNLAGTRSVSADTIQPARPSSTFNASWLVSSAEGCSSRSRARTTRRKRSRRSIGIPRWSCGRRTSSRGGSTGETRPRTSPKWSRS